MGGRQRVRYGKSQFKIMPIASCFKSLICLFLFITVEVTTQLRLRQLGLNDKLARGGVLGLIFAGYVPLASQVPLDPILVTFG